MKKNILRKGSILLLLVALFTPAFVKAAEESENKACITHKNYYLYLLPTTVPDFANRVYKSEGNTTEIYTGAYFPKLLEGAKAPDGNTGIINGRICLSKEGKADGNSLQCSYGTWTLEEYYRMMIIVSNESKKITFKDDNGTSRTTGLYEVEAERENGKKVIEHYYGGSQWFTCNDANCASITEEIEGTDVSSLSIAKLATGSYLPSQTILTFDPLESTRATIKRRINVKDFLDYVEYDEEGNPKDDGSGNIVINEESKKVVPFPNPKQGETGTILLAPAAYYVEYQTCGDYYTATINYYYYQNGDITEDRVEFDDETVENPYVKDYLSAGDSIEKASPELEGCVIVDTNGKKYDKDKTVELTIDAENPKDVEKNVYYYCKALDEGKENNTGDALIYIAWAIGLGAIGYSVYYFKNLKKEEI